MRRLKSVEPLIEKCEPLIAAQLRHLIAVQLRNRLRHVVDLRQDGVFELRGVGDEGV
jgi:hypothetical protein